MRMVNTSQKPGLPTDSTDSGIAAANEVVEKLVEDIKLGKSEGRRIFLVGDSTVSPFKDDFYIPRNGWGMKMQDYIERSKAEVVNLAISGRSSKSFLIEKNYKVLKEFIKKDDYLIIGFGHNDEKLEEARYSNPNLLKNEEGGFQNYLYEYYIKLARSAGAIPVLCTPIVRRPADGNFRGIYVHVTKTENVRFPGGDYPRAIRLLAADEGVLLVDLTKITKCLYEKLGQSENKKLLSAKSEKDEDLDMTHLNAYGAAVVAKIVCEKIAEQDSVFAGLLSKSAGKSA